MPAIKKLPGRIVFVKAAGMLFCVLVSVCANYRPSKANLPNARITNDTLPQAEIFNLKRAAVYVVLMDADSVHIRLQAGDSIMMTRANFDELPGKVKKEISARGDGMFIPEEIESTYPGGQQGWMNYLNQTFRYPQKAVKNSIQGTVVVQFAVDDKGMVSNIEAISGPNSGGLREETIRVIQNSGKWNPAVWNGYRVKSYKRQPLTFKLER